MGLIPTVGTHFQGVSGMSYGLPLKSVRFGAAGLGLSWRVCVVARQARTCRARRGFRSGIQRFSSSSSTSEMVYKDVVVRHEVRQLGLQEGRVSLLEDAVSQLSS